MLFGNIFLLHSVLEKSRLILEDGLADYGSGSLAVKIHPQHLEQFLAYLLNDLAYLILDLGVQHTASDNYY